MWFCERQEGHVRSTLAHACNFSRYNVMYYIMEIFECKQTRPSKYGCEQVYDEHSL